MIAQTLLSAVVAVLAMPSSAAAAPQVKHTTEPSLTQKLSLLDSFADRYAILKDEDFVFDFNKSSAPFADRRSFPALTGTGGAMASASLDACSMSFFHLHPRAAELFTVISGEVTTEMRPELGAVTADGKPRVITTKLTAGQMTVFPQGSFHTQLNEQCHAAVAVAGFTSDDPGAGGVASQLFDLPNEVIQSSLGNSIKGEDIDKIRDAIPKDLVFKIESCLKRCNLKKRSD